MRATLTKTLCLAGVLLALASSAPGQDPPQSTVEKLVGEAAARAAEGELERAIELYSGALVRQPDLRAALLGRARAFEDGGDYRAALRDLDELVAATPDDAEVRFARGRVRNRHGKVLAALEDFEVAVQGGEPQLEVLAWRGITLCEMERYPDAERDLQQVFAALDDTDDALAWVAEWYAQCLFSQEKWLAAHAPLLFAVDVGDPSAWTLAGLSHCELERGDASAALAYVDRAIALEEDVGWYHATRAQALEELDRGSEAREAWALAACLDPDYEGYDVDYTAVVQVFSVLFAWLAAVLVLLSAVGILARRRVLAWVESAAEGCTRMRYDADLRDLWSLYLQNVVLTVLTLGVYRFWAKVKTRQFRYRHTEFAGGRFDYHATGRQKFIGFLKGMALLAPVVVGLFFLNDRLAAHMGEDTAFEVCIWTFAFVLYVLRPLVLVGGQRFNLSRTSWSQMRFRFTGRVGEAYRIYGVGFVLMLCTFGLFYSWHRCRVAQFRAAHTKMGDAAFRFRGMAVELARILWFGPVLCLVTGGLYVPWYVAARRSFYVDNLRFEGHSFRSNMTGGAVLVSLAPALLLTVVTFGLALPYLLHCWYELEARTLVYVGELDTASLRSTVDGGASALVEGIGEAGDAMAEIGDLFGV